LALAGIGIDGGVRQGGGLLAIDLLCGHNKNSVFSTDSSVQMAQFILLAKQFNRQWFDSTKIEAPV
jgi:hypothetical protein